MQSSILHAIGILCLVLGTLCCTPHLQQGAKAPEPSKTGKEPRSTSAIWHELLKRSPYPHAAPLPPLMRTPLDGTYVKRDPNKTAPVPCRRCPDYAPQGGIWKLNLDRGVFRIFHEFTGWRSIGSFRVDGARVQFFNDPYCMEEFGTYDWTSTEERLKLHAVMDECAIGMRAQTLAKLPWLSCRQPLMEAGGDHRQPKPPGCD